MDSHVPLIARSSGRNRGVIARCCSSSFGAFARFAFRGHGSVCTVANGRTLL